MNSDGWAEPDDPAPGQSAEPPAAPAPYPSYAHGHRPVRGRHRHAALIVVLGAVLTAGILAAEMAIELRSTLRAAHRPVSTVRTPTPTPPDPLTLPQSFAGYVRETGTAADAFEDAARKGGRLVARAKAAIYDKPGRQPLRFIGVSASDPYVAEELRSTSPADEADAFMPGSFVHSRAYPAGPLGGVLRCGRDRVLDQPESVCVWVDRSTIGLVFDEGAADPKDLALVVRSLRAAAQH